MNRTRVAVVGVGHLGRHHARVFASLPDVELVGVVDSRIEQAETVAEACGTTAFADYRDMLDKVDAVSVAVPTRFHREVAGAFLERGIPAMIEKPLATTLAEAEELVKLAEKAGVPLQVGHIERFNPTFLELQSILEDMTIVALSARRLSPFDTSNTDVDVIRDLMIHDIDIALTLLGGAIDGLDAFGRSARTSSTDYAVATLSYNQGPMATLTASRVTEQKVRLLEVTAIGAYVEADLLNKSICIHRRTFPEYVFNHQRPVRYRQESLVEQIHIPTAEPLFLELQDFVRCVGGGGAPRVTALDGLRALQVATCIRDQLSVARGSAILAAS